VGSGRVMKIKAVSGIMLTLLLTSILVLAFSAKLVAQTFYYNFEITITPESPTVLDPMEVTISFDKASISDMVTFGPLSRMGNQFLVNVTIDVPQYRLGAIGYAEETYFLEKLPAGIYSFNVTVSITGWGHGLYHHSKSFSVTEPDPAPDLCIEGIVLPYVPMVFQVMYFPAPEPPGLGYRINVTVTNQGTADAGSFQVSFSAYWEEEEVPELVLKETIASLEQGANKTVLFNLVSCENYGNYTLIIMADCNDDVAELDETNNVKMTWVIGTVRGDIDGDGTVDRYDFGLLAMEYGRIFEKPPYHPADFDYNGYVDRYDFGILAMNYGKTV
jgi:hypothetical protein